MIDVVLREENASGGGHRGGGPKNVVIIVDYSGSMSGSKIRSAVSNVRMVFDKYIDDDDSVMLIHFTGSVIVDFNLQKKKANKDMMQAKIDQLTSPSGSTAFYSSVVEGLNALKAYRGGGSSWVVALTDGEDNSSRITHATLLERLEREKGADLIVIGVGSDVDESKLKPLAQATPRGVYIFAEGDKSSIDSAFGEVARIIQGQVVLEDV